MASTAYPRAPPRAEPCWLVACSAAPACPPSPCPLGSHLAPLARRHVQRHVAVLVGRVQRSARRQQHRRKLRRPALCGVMHRAIAFLRACHTSVGARLGHQLIRRAGRNLGARQLRPGFVRALRLAVPSLCLAASALLVLCYLCWLHA
eukprot:355018-Chlamydomonas_euryale.AAC.6